MSAIPVIEPIIEQAPSVRTLPRRPAPVIIELPRTRAPRQQVAKIRARKQTSSMVASAASFVVVASVTFCSMSLIGQVMVEKARREGIRASVRARTAANQLAELRTNIQQIRSPGGIDEYAVASGFVPLDSVLVAKVVTPVGTISR